MGGALQGEDLAWEGGEGGVEGYSVTTASCVEGVGGLGFAWEGACCELGGCELVCWGIGVGE